MNSYSKSNAGKISLVLAAGLVSCMAACSKEDAVVNSSYVRSNGLDVTSLNTSDASSNTSNQSSNKGIESVVKNASNDAQLRDFTDNYKAEVIKEVYVERPLFSKYHLLFNGNTVDVIKNGDFVAGRVQDLEKGKYGLSTDSDDIAIKTIKFYSWERKPANCRDVTAEESCGHYIKSMDVKNDKFEFNIGNYGIYELEIDIVKDKEEGKRYLIIESKPQKATENKVDEKVTIVKVEKEKPSLKDALKDGKKNKVVHRVNIPNHKVRFSYSR